MFVLLKDATALVHPCPVEGFGLPVIEAMSMAVPVIVADHGAAAEAAATPRCKSVPPTPKNGPKPWIKSPLIFSEPL